MIIGGYFIHLASNSIVDMVLAETNIVEDEAGFKVIDAGSYVLTNPYHKDEAVSTYWALKDTKSITVADNVEGFGLHNVQATIEIGVECTVDNTGSGRYTASTSALSIDIEHLFPSFQRLLFNLKLKFEKLPQDTIITEALFMLESLNRQIQYFIIAVITIIVGILMRL